MYSLPVLLMTLAYIDSRHIRRAKFLFVKQGGSLPRAILTSANCVPVTIPRAVALFTQSVICHCLCLNIFPYWIRLY